MRPFSSDECIEASGGHLTLAGADSAGLAVIAGRGSTLALVLSGVIIGGFCSAVVGLLQTLADPTVQLPSILYWLLGSFGMSGTTRIAACLNAAAALIVLLVLRKPAAESADDAKQPAANAGCEIPFRTALLWSALSGFLALSWEIIWSRVFNFASASKAPVFGYMLGSYLLGLALGSLLSPWTLKQTGDLRLKFGRWVLLSSVGAFMIAPLTAIMATQAYWEYGFYLVIAAGTLLGVTFPLLCQAAIPPNKDTGSRLSWLYLANIIGSGTGSLQIGRAHV